MEMKDIKNKATDELRALGGTLRESVREFRFGGAGSRKRDVKQAKTARRDIARIETELSVRRIAEQAK